MALKDTWTDKLDGIDDVLASDINSIAQSAIALEENTELLSERVDELENQEVPKIELAPTLEGNEPDKAPSVRAVNEGLAGKLGKIETALDSIIEIQNSLIGGDGE